jgi:TonB family protein
MFDLAKRRNTRRNRALLASFLIHGVVLYCWLHRAPWFVRPSTVAWGHYGQSDTLVYFPRAELQESAEKTQLHLSPKHKAPKKAPQIPVQSARRGSPAGSSFNGSTEGTEAMPAIPLVFPDPTIYPWELRNGLQGDVVVEVTIDERGNVTQTRLLESLAQDIDQKVVATVREWRFRPATVEGLAVSSRQDVHFHFPS